MGVDLRLRWLLRRCPRCGRYTLRKDKCPVCGETVYVPHPPRFSPEDKYVKYRYMMKKLAGLLAVDEHSNKNLRKETEGKEQVQVQSQ